MSTSSGLRVRPWAWPLRPAYFSGLPLTSSCFYTLKYLKISFWVLLTTILLSGMGETQEDWQEENEQRQPGVSNNRNVKKKKNKTKTPFWQDPERESQKRHYHIAKAGSRGHCALGECSIPLKISVLFSTATGSFSPVTGIWWRLDCKVTHMGPWEQNMQGLRPMVAQWTAITLYFHVAFCMFSDISISFFRYAEACLKE